ncbi:MAG: hypothetical protein JWQ04_206 [Pedosphaera sp.]|nr:hypothetical protein [Pedosphaera sp.]
MFQMAQQTIVRAQANGVVGIKKSAITWMNPP